MSYRSTIPDSFLQSPAADKLITVLDKLNEYKRGEIYESSRVYNPGVLLGHKRYMIKIVTDYGFGIPPYELPRAILERMILNVKDLFSLAGTKMGLHYLVNILLYGRLSLDDSRFYPKASYIIPGDVDGAGHISPEEDYFTDQLYLYGGEDTFLPRFLSLDIDTPYANNAIVTGYFEASLRRFIPFIDDNTVIDIKYNLIADYIPCPYSYQYFEKPS